MKELAAKAYHHWCNRLAAAVVAAVADSAQQLEDQVEPVAVVGQQKQRGISNGGRGGGKASGKGGSAPARPKTYTLCWRHAKYGGQADKCADASCKFAKMGN